MFPPLPADRDAWLRSVRQNHEVAAMAAAGEGLDSDPQQEHWILFMQCQAVVQTREQLGLAARQDEPERLMDDIEQVDAEARALRLDLPGRAEDMVSETQVFLLFYLAAHVQAGALAHPQALAIGQACWSACADDQDAADEAGGAPARLRGDGGRGTWPGPAAGADDADDEETAQCADREGEGDGDGDGQDDAEAGLRPDEGLSRARRRTAEASGPRRSAAQSAHAGQTPGGSPGEDDREASDDDEDADAPGFGGARRSGADRDRATMDVDDEAEGADDADDDDDRDRDDHDDDEDDDDGEPWPVTHPAPRQADGWVDEIVSAYLRRRQPLVLRPAHGKSFVAAPGSLLEAATVLALGNRGADADAEEIQELIATIHAMEEDVRGMGPEWPTMQRIPPLAFAMYYVWVHLAIRLTDEDQAMAVMQTCTERLDEFEDEPPSRSRPGMGGARPRQRPDRR